MERQKEPCSIDSEAGHLRSAISLNNSNSEDRQEQKPLQDDGDHYHLKRIAQEGPFVLRDRRPSPVVESCCRVTSFLENGTMSEERTAGASNHQEEKTRLECEKLKAETESIRRPVWHTAALYTSIAPVLLAALGLLWSWQSGWFDVQRTRISNEKSLVEAQTERLRSERSLLESETRSQREHVTALESAVAQLRTEQSALTNQTARLEKERDEMRVAKEAFESEAKRLSGADTNAARLLSDLQAAQATRENLSVSIQMLQTNNLNMAQILASKEAWQVRRVNFYFVRLDLLGLVMLDLNDMLVTSPPSS
jgi:hypothetical protein